MSDAGFLSEIGLQRLWDGRWKLLKEEFQYLSLCRAGAGYATEVQPCVQGDLHKEPGRPPNATKACLGNARPAPILWFKVLHAMGLKRSLAPVRQ